MLLPTDERLGRWKNKLSAAHATPVCLIGVGHDHNTGQLVVCTTEEINDAELALMLRYALREIEP